MNPIDFNNNVYDFFAQTMIPNYTKNFKDPGYIYHYTNLQACINILEKSEFWLSHMLQMNDPKEIEFGIDVIMHYLRTKLDLTPNIKIYELISSGTQFNLTLEETMLKLELPFSMSFSAKGDLLSQWISYGNKGYGVTLGVRWDRLLLTIKEVKSNISPVLLPIQYFGKNYAPSSQEADNFLAEIVNFFRYLDSILKSIDNQGFINNHFKRIALEYLYLFASFIKHDFYKEESEWRLFLRTGYGNPQIHILPHKETLKMYYRILFDKQPKKDNQIFSLASLVQEFTLGPSHMRDLKVQKSLEISILQNLRSQYNVGFSSGVLKF